MSKTIEVTAAPAPANEAIPVEVKHEAIDYVTASSKLRREMAKVVFGKIIDNLSDDDLNKYVGVAADINAQYSAHLKHEVATHEPTIAEVPQDAADYNYDEIEAQVAAEAAAQPLRVAAAERMGFSWVKGGGISGNLLAFKTSLNARREARLAEKTAGMSDEERAAYIAKWEKRSEQISKASAFALGTVMTVWTFKSGIDHLAPMLMGGGDTGAKHLAMDAFNATDNKGTNHEYALADSEKPGLTDFDKTVLNHYNNSDSSFYDFAHKQFRGDFGPGLHALPTDGNMPAGFNDWMSRNQHEPNGLANLVSGLKLDGHGDSMADRNALADIYDNDKMAQVKADIMVQNELRDPNKYDMKTINLKSYNSTLMVDHNGDPVISMKNNIHLGGHAIEITNKQTGEKTYWRIECGGYQQVWPVEEAPARPSVATLPESHPHQNPVIPEKPVVPATPPTNTPPVNIPPINIPPVNIPPVDIPPTDIPPVVNEAKKPWLDINANPNLTETKKMGDVRMGSGAPQTADQVQAPPATYIAPKPATDNTDLAPGAKQNPLSGLFGNGQKPQQSGLSTGAASGGNNGNTKGKVSE